MSSAPCATKGSKESRSLPWIDNVACQACVTHSPTTFVVYPAGLSFVIMFSKMAQCTAAVVIKIALHGRLRLRHCLRMRSSFDRCYCSANYTKLYCNRSTNSSCLASATSLTCHCLCYLKKKVFSHLRVFTVTTNYYCGKWRLASHPMAGPLFPWKRPL